MSRRSVGLSVGDGRDNGKSQNVSGKFALKQVYAGKIEAPVEKAGHARDLSRRPVGWRLSFAITCFHILTTDRAFEAKQPRKVPMAGAVNSTCAYSVICLFSACDSRPGIACAVYSVGDIRCLSNTFSPRSSLVAYRFARMGNSYGTVSLAVSAHTARELVESQRGS